MLLNTFRLEFERSSRLSYRMIECSVRCINQQTQPYLYVLNVKNLRKNCVSYLYSYNRLMHNVAHIYIIIIQPVCYGAAPTGTARSTSLCHAQFGQRVSQAINGKWTFYDPSDTHINLTKFTQAQRPADRQPSTDGEGTLRANKKKTLERVRCILYVSVVYSKQEAISFLF